MRDAKQTWCAICQWPGRAKFLVGTFVTDFGTPDQEAREAALRQWASTMQSILPLEVAPPEVIELVPGAIIYVERK
jgi:hypothetical protein